MLLLQLSHVVDSLRMLLYKYLAQRLESSCHLGSVEEVSAVVELLQESSQWFPGGSKQMKVPPSHSTSKEGKRERVPLISPP